MPEPITSEEGGTVEADVSPIPIGNEPFIKVPERILAVEICYVTTEQLDEIEHRAKECAENLALAGVAVGVLCPVALALFTGGSEFHVSHPVVFDTCVVVTTVSFLWGLSTLLSWRRSRDRARSLIIGIKRRSHSHSASR
jgi:hypothetical protein